jgi:hypothetical protein
MQSLVAWLALIISLVNLGWQVINYHLQGPRVRVYLEPALMTHKRDVWIGPAAGWSVVPSSSRWFVDLARVRVVNVGRGVQTVSDVRLELIYERGSGSFLPRIVSLERSVSTNSFRLDSSHEELLYFDIAELFALMKDDPVKIRARVRLPTNKTITSPDQTAWSFPKRQRGERRTLLPAGQVLSPEMRLFRSVWHALSEVQERPNLDWFNSFALLLERGLSEIEIRVHLDMIMSDRAEAEAKIVREQVARYFRRRTREGS